MTKIIIIFQFSLIMNSLPQELNESKKIPDGYYYGSDKLFKKAFIKISNTTAIADLIFYQKFPRKLISDTLFYNKSNDTWSGRISILYKKSDKYCLATVDKSTIFGKMDIPIRLNEAYYKKNIDEQKNSAVWQQYFVIYSSTNGEKDGAIKQFHELEKRHDLNKMIRTLKHIDFLKEMEKLKTELKY